MSLPGTSFAQKQCEPCEDCGKTSPQNSYCVDCDSNYCDDCWEKAKPHKPGKVNRDGIPHEKINKQVKERLEKIFTPTSDPNTQRRLHQEDRETTWFGVCRGVMGHPELQDHGRYTRLIRESWTSQHLERWPQLVSFVGQTGCGKSTLVKILIDCQERLESEGVGFQSPVAGSVNNQAPTSGDVHLYADPGTYHERYPMLYADCEGLDGGEEIPVGAQYQEAGLAAPDPTQSRGKRATSIPSSNHSLVPNKLRKAHKAAKRKYEVRWAVDSESCKREFAVRHLYPRLLYAFSDVVVFVLRNERTFESGALVPMLKWASSSIGGVVGQPAKPHIIIVSNFTDPGINVAGWDSRSATRNLLDTYASAINVNPDVKRHAEYWKSVGRPVKSTEDLILCYYSSVQVVRIPQKGRYGLVNQQITTLHRSIQRRCTEAEENKKRLRVMFNTEEFQIALSAGFDHFSSGLDEPFDFVELSCSLNPIPTDFGGNILRLALAIKSDPKFRNSSGREIFKELGHMVASCVMLDYTRHHIKGTPERLISHYEESYNRALVEFCEDWWPCGFENASGRCVIPRRNHAKGHQNQKGKILRDGQYRSMCDFSEETYREEWKANLDENLQSIRYRMGKMTTSDSPMDEEQAAIVLHRQLMDEFYSNLGSLAAYRNHSACFSCLRELPEHPLPCGHVLCTPCVKSFAAKKDNTSYTMDRCPLHPGNKWDEDWPIPIKPSLAGVRVLALDGGGVRGIVELEVLRAIQRSLGGFRITSFFDLIVGSNTGGIIALGLGEREWSMNECAVRFISLCEDAYFPREFHDLPGFNALATFHHKSKYKTRPFEGALRKTFGENPLFGGRSQTLRYQRKVAVLSALNPGGRAAILTNYNRQQSEDAESAYKFERPEKTTEELMTWEACRATSASPRHFKPFVNERSGASYFDSALYSNNPSRVANQERKLLWPDTSDQPPDMLLSIGTGWVPEAPNPGAWERIAGILQPGSTRFDSITDSQREWQQFYHEVHGDNLTIGMANERYIRLNPDVKTKIEMDDVRSLKNIQDSVKATLDSSKWRIDCGLIAKRLISTSFYFERDENRLDQDKVRGRICCRFSDGSSELRDLGKYLRKLQSSAFSPQFIINREWQDTPQALVISREVTRAMMNDVSMFKMDVIEIPTSRHEKTSISLRFSYPEREDYPISGFPQILLRECATAPKRKSVIGSPTSPSNTILEDSASIESAESTLASWARGLGKKTKKSSATLQKRKASDYQFPPPPPLLKLLPEDRTPTPFPTSRNYTTSQETVGGTQRSRFQQPVSHPSSGSDNTPGRLGDLSVHPTSVALDQDCIPSRPRGPLQSSMSVRVPDSRPIRRIGRSSSFSARITAQAQAPGQAPANDQNRPRGFGDGWRAQIHTLTPPPSHFRADDITGVTPYDPTVDGYVEMGVDTELPLPVTPNLAPASASSRNFEELSEEQQIEMALAESMKIY